MEWLKGASWLEVLANNLYPPETSVLEPAVKKALRQSVREGYQVLDAGCGDGRFSEHLAGLNAIVTAVDIDEELVKAVGGRGINALKADVCDLPFESESFNYVLCSMVLNAVPEYAQAINEMSRVLTTEGGGLIAVTHPLLAKPEKYHTEHIIEFPFNGGSFLDIHRPLSSYVNALSVSSLSIVGMIEPQARLEGYPEHEYLLFEIQNHKVRAKKPICFFEGKDI